MKNSHLFYKYYDLLFAQKDYIKETKIVLGLYKRFAEDLPEKILEIGCGTGNHTRELAELNAQVVAIDIDPEMVNIAGKKLKGFSNVRVVGTEIEELSEGNFDLSLALFNVVTYITDIASLDSFMAAVEERLKPGGVFVFDLWNGAAALKDPPKVKVVRAAEGNKRIICTLVPETDFDRARTLLTYNFEVFEDTKRTEEGSYSFSQTLWLPEQIASVLAKSGLEVKLNAPAMDLSRQARDTDWKIMYCCQKI